MKGWIRISNASTNRSVLVNIDNVVTVAPALNSGNAYCVLKLTNGDILIADEAYDEVLDLIEEAVDG